MNDREKRLATIVVGLLAMVMLWSAWGKLGEAYSSREANLTNLRGDVRKKEFAMKQATLAQARREQYKLRSLPANRELALFHYRSWLRQLMDESGWKDVDLRPQQVPARRGVYERLAFTVSAEASLTSLVKFLHGFYATNHLHQIRRLDIQPKEKGTGGNLELVLQVEALCLPDAIQKDKLASGAVGPFPQSPLDAYLKSIVDRNVFAPYTPPAPPPKPKPKVEIVEKTTPLPPPKPAFDEAKFAYVTGILQDTAGEMQVWMQVRTTGETLKLHVGDSFKLGASSGEVVRIDARQVVLSLGKEHLLVSLGESVREGIPVPAAGL